MAPGAAFSDRVSNHRLPGGARLAVLANPHAPTATIAGTLLAGPALATNGRFAVPGLVAAMLDRGTTDHGRMELARELEDHGLQLVVRASTSTPTIVSFSAQGLAEELPRLVRLLVEVLQRPSFPAEELDKLREQVLGSLAREREETSARAFAALMRGLFPEGHPLHRRPIEVREHEVRSLTCGELADFHAAVYGPKTLALAVVGDVEAGNVASLFKGELAGWDGAGDVVYTADDRRVPEPPEERIQIVDRPNIDVFFGHRGRLLRGDADYPAAVLANSCLGQSTLTSRLGVAVRDGAGLTYGIYSRFFGTLHVAGPWATALGVSVDNLDRAVELSLEVIAKYVEEGPTEEELADERSALAGAYRVGLATNSGIARELVTALTAGEPIERLDRFPEQLLAVDRDQVVEAIRTHFHPDQIIVTAAGDFEG
ncbi:M16 family metallopeptidase [Acidobacteriota bacterium]